MKRNCKTYSTATQVSAIFMMLTLFWLTISIPFVLASKQEIAKQATSCGEEEASNPLGSGTEEKASTNSSLTEEFLHEHFTINHFFSAISQQYKCEDADTYLAYHGELTVPPPESGYSNWEQNKY